MDCYMKVFSLKHIRNWYAKNKDGSYDMATGGYPVLKMT
jgi:hypothetical protein